MDHDDLNAMEILKRAAAHGVKVSLSGYQLVLKAPMAPPAGVLAELEQNKTAIINFLREEKTRWSVADWREFYQEQAAVAEYEEGLPRSEAERLAFFKTCRLLLTRGQVLHGAQPSQKQLKEADEFLAELGIMEPMEGETLH